MPENVIFSSRVAQRLELDDPKWRLAEPVQVDRGWNGVFAGSENGGAEHLRTEIRSTWDSGEICFYFNCTFGALSVDPTLGKGGPINYLWDYDVVVVFLKAGIRTDYFEFQVSPLAQWQDIHVYRPREEVDFEWRSHLETKVVVDRTNRTWKTLLCIPFSSLSKPLGSTEAPQPGESWRVNLFRIAGNPEPRHYLSWRPTFTCEPDFHVPGAFGHLIFKDQEISR